ncbi:MAG: hypothetical protein V4510_07675 [bacterium]
MDRPVGILAIALLCGLCLGSPGGGASAREAAPGHPPAGAVASPDYLGILHANSAMSVADQLPAGSTTRCIPCAQSDMWPGDFAAPAVPMTSADSIAQSSDDGL